MKNLIYRDAHKKKGGISRLVWKTTCEKQLTDSYHSSVECYL